MEVDLLDVAVSLESDSLHGRARIAVVERRDLVSVHLHLNEI